LAGIVAVVLDGEWSNKKVNAVYYLAHSMRMLQHRGKAYWRLIVGNSATGKEGSLPPDDVILKIAQREKLNGASGIGYLSKKSPQFPSMHSIWVAIDGFFVDTEKLHLHPYIGTARDSDSLFKIYNIFTQLLIEKQNPSRAAEFIDRHLRGNWIMKVGEDIYAYRDSTGFKPLVRATNKDGSINMVSSENSLRTSLIDMEFSDIPPGQLLRLNHDSGFQSMTDPAQNKVMMDPFEFIRESHVAATISGKSVYSIRKNIGKEQANFFSQDLEIESAYAEPDYTRPMTLGFSLEYQKHSKGFEVSEGIIKDRYDDSDHMIDFSEQVSKNKLLTTGRSLKFVMQNLVSGKRVASVQGTIQTGSTVRETIYYLRNAGARRIDVIVSYVPTVDGRQVGLYTQNRDLVANKYVGEVSSIEQLNEHVAKEIGSDSVLYNSPAVLAKGIGVQEESLWFPEWVRFLDYRK